MSDIAATAAAVSAIRQALDGRAPTVRECHLAGEKCPDPGCERCRLPLAFAAEQERIWRARADAIAEYMDRNGRAPPRGWNPRIR